MSCADRLTAKLIRQFMYWGAPKYSLFLLRKLTKDSTQIAYLKTKLSKVDVSFVLNFLTDQKSNIHLGSR